MAQLLCQCRPTVHSEQREVRRMPRSLKLVGPMAKKEGKEVKKLKCERKPKGCGPLCKWAQ